MSSPSPVPLLRPPVPGARSQSGSRTPRLTLGIPPSPNVKPVGGDGHPPVPDLPSLRPATRPTAPKLSLATPMGGHAPINEPGPNLRRQPLSLNTSAVNGPSEVSHRL